MRGTGGEHAGDAEREDGEHRPEPRPADAEREQDETERKGRGREARVEAETASDVTARGRRRHEVQRRRDQRDDPEAPQQRLRGPQGRNRGLNREPGRAQGPAPTYSDQKGARKK